jgi:hypothetical protein
MPQFSWRRRKTEYFGQVWVQYAEVQLQRTDGSYQAFSIQVDSGAVVSLLRRSVADLLGLRSEDGREVRLGSVGGSRVRAFIHELKARFSADSPPLPARFAIADSESVPNLLGRLDLFDRLQIDFDGTLQETRISDPWLDAVGVRIWRFVRDTQSAIYDRWRDNPLPGAGDKASSHLCQRADQTLAAIAGLCKLHRSFAVAPLVRTLFELSTQLEYILQDPEPRAQDYLDYMHITRYKQQQALLDNPVGVISQHLAKSPRRRQGEQEARAQFDRVRPRFRTEKGKIYAAWYRSTFADLARRMGREQEYHLWYRLCSGWAHGDPGSGGTQIFQDPKRTMVVSTGFLCRMLHAIADAKQIILSAVQYDGLKEGGDALT